MLALYSDVEFWTYVTSSPGLVQLPIGGGGDEGLKQIRIGIKSTFARADRRMRKKEREQTLRADFKITTSLGDWIQGSPSTCTGMSVLIRILI